MIDFSVSILPLLVVAFGNFFLSWFWYSPVLFAKPWMKALGVSRDKEMTAEEKKAMPFLFLSAFVSSFLLSYGLQILVHSLGAVTFFSGAAIGVIAWVTFALTHSLNTLFEGRKPQVLLINNGLFLLTYVGFAGLVAVWR